MKKSVITLAILGSIAGASQAQSSLTVYGSFDGGVRSQTNVDAAGNRRLTMSGIGTFNTTRLGFKGVEDLGGGMNAHFTLESGFNPGTGALDNAGNVLFNRTAAVGLGGAWGNIDLGRQYTVAYKTIGSYEPYNFNFPVITLIGSLAGAGVRFNNDIQYYGTFGPFTARAEYALGEVAGSTSTGASMAMGGKYTDGPLSVGAAYTKRNIATFDNNHFTVGGTYQFGPARLVLGYANEKQDTTAVDTVNKYSWIGLNYDVSPFLRVTGAFYNAKTTGGAAGAGDGKKDQYILGAQYFLSKRTSLYAEVDNAKMGGIYRVGAATATPQTRQSGVSFGMNHLF